MTTQKEPDRMILDGEEYVAVTQGEQTFAIPVAEYEVMQREGGATLQIQQDNNTTAVVVAQPQQPPQLIPVPPPTPQQLKLVPVPHPPTPLNLTPVSGPPPPKPLQPKPVNNVKTFFSPEQVVQNKFKPIKVDNWGIFVLNRLHSFFQKKDECDLTLKFASRNAQIKLHRLIADVCTDFFKGKVDDLGEVDLEKLDFQPEFVAPVIRFMYTGRLEVRPGTFSQLRLTAHRLGMSVLTKLMDAQLRQPAPVNSNKKGNSRRALRDDPVKQMKRIKRVEKKFTLEEKRAKMALKEKTQEGEKLPGKKLPIWKKRSQPTTTITTDNNDDQDKPVLDKNNVRKSYNGAAKAREMQNHLAFERIREKNEKEMSVEEMGEFMAEQRRKLDFDMDEYYNDNDAGLEEDEDYEEETIVTPSKAILKTPTTTPQQDDPAPRKSVRFSLKPDEESSKPPPKKKQRIEEEEPDQLETALAAFENETEDEPQQQQQQQQKVIIKSDGDIPDQAQVVQELLKKFPDILKSNKQVKVKVMVKDKDGNATQRLITLKTNKTPEAAEPIEEDAPRMKTVPKVMYSGNKGRPKQFRQQLKPSSEAEALSNVASGIATSLAVSSEANEIDYENGDKVPKEVPAADLAKDWADEEEK